MVLGANSEWDKTKDWFWEGNIQNKIAMFLRRNGFQIICEVNTLSKRRGPDILAERNGLRLHVETKGFPSDKYVDGKMKGQEKKTKPTTQARHWFAQAIREVILAKGENPSLEIAIGLPKIGTYEDLIRRSEWAFKKLGLFCYLVNNKDEVEVVNPSSDSSARTFPIKERLQT